MLKFLKKEANMTHTENGAVTYRSTQSECLDLFATIGALRRERDEEITNRFLRAYAEDADLAMKTLFFARDIRGGIGERRVFRTILKWLADNEPQSLEKNIQYIAEYGRYDDLLVLMGTTCEGKVLHLIKKQLAADFAALEAGESVSLLAKWLPSVNASNEDVIRQAKRIARAMGMNDAQYQNEGRRALWGGAQYQVQAAIDQLKAEGRFQEIQKTIKALKKEHELNIPKDLAYVEGKLFEDYIHDMKLTQQFAMLNRKAMVDVIMTGMGFTAVETFTTIHNYIDTDAMILRKGSVSAKAGEKLLIPINMRDGSLICSGKGNEDWNCSAPHGAGRLMSRKAAFNALSMEEFQKEMEGIYTTCVVPDTLDESPMAYKSMEEIVAQIGPTAEIIERIRPVYNFKAAD